MEVKFHKNIEDSLLKFAVIVAKHNGKWVFCKHRERNTYEVPGGHREKNEIILDTAKRELFEETGAYEYEIIPICVYSVIGKTRVNASGTESYGMLYYADIKTFKKLPEAEKEASIIQERHTEISSKEGLIVEYLNRLLPENWDDLDIAARRLYIHGSDFGEIKEGTIKRDKVCAMEIWIELLEGDVKEMNPAKAKEINDILRKIEGWQPYLNGTGKLSFGKVYGYQKAFVRKSTE